MKEYIMIPKDKFSQIWDKTLCLDNIYSFLKSSSFAEYVWDSSTKERYFRETTDLIHKYTFSWIDALHKSKIDDLSKEAISNEDLYMIAADVIADISKSDEDDATKKSEIRGIIKFLSAKQIEKEERKD